MMHLLRPILQQILIAFLLSYLAKFGHLFLLWLTKKLIKGLAWAAKRTDLKADDELVAIMQKALEQMPREVAPSSAPSEDK